MMPLFAAKTILMRLQQRNKSVFSAANVDEYRVIIHNRKTEFILAPDRHRSFAHSSAECNAIAAPGDNAGRLGTMRTPIVDASKILLYFCASFRSD